jgi:hypothetical protein
MYECMYVSMYVCIYMYIYTHTHTHTHTCIYVLLLYSRPRTRIFADAQRREGDLEVRIRDYALQYICPHPREYVSHTASGMRHCPHTATHVSYTCVFIGHAARSALCCQGGGLLRALF